jgi:hypothetical protein
MYLPIGFFRQMDSHRGINMHTETRPYLLFTLTFALLPAISGCISTGRPEWKWQRCYKGPPRAFADISVLLVAPHRVNFLPMGHPVPLRIRSIDGKRVRDATEYHLLPGDHIVVSKLKVPRRFLIEYKDDACALASEPIGECTTGAATATLTLEPGIVYRLAADLDWQRDGPNRVYWRGRHGKWAPRVEPLGSFETLKDALAHQQELLLMQRQEKRGPSGIGAIPWPYIALRFGAKPPKHWVLSEDDE